MTESLPPKLNCATSSDAVVVLSVDMDLYTNLPSVCCLKQSGTPCPRAKGADVDRQQRFEELVVS